MHGCDPATALYLPAAHTSHDPDANDVPMIVPLYPAWQRQSDANDEDTALKEFEGHPVHDACPASAWYVLAVQSLQGYCPTSDLYFPAPHASHCPDAVSVPDIVPLYPASHKQSLAALDDTGLDECEGQLLHDDDATMPWYMSWLHCEHKNVPKNCLYFPASQVTQLLLSALGSNPASHRHSRVSRLVEILVALATQAQEAEAPAEVLNTGQTRQSPTALKLVSVISPFTSRSLPWGPLSKPKPRDASKR